MQITVWTVAPNHYQAPFFHALRQLGVDLHVNYYGRLTNDRVTMGWDTFEPLPPGERYLLGQAWSSELVARWGKGLHVIPGCGTWFLRKLVLQLCRRRAAWVHWSEPARPGWRWYAGYVIKRWYAGLVNRFALGAFGIGLLACQDMRRWGIRPEKISLLTYSNPAMSFSVAPDSVCARFRGERRAFMFIGALCRRKGTDVLLRAFARVARHHTDWVLILVGPDGSRGVYEGMARDLGIRERVLFRGPVPPSEISGVLKCANVLVLPSRFDGWGVVLNEGALMGLPLVASDRCGAAWHLIEPGENGFRTRAGDARSLAAAMGAYASDGELAQRHGERSVRLAAEYGAERNARRLIAAVEAWSALRAGSHAGRH